MKPIPRRSCSRLLCAVALSPAPRRSRPTPRTAASPAVFKQMNVPVEAKFKKLQRADRLRRRAPGGRQGQRRHRHRQPRPGRPRVQQGSGQEGMVQRRPVPEGDLRLDRDQAGRRRQAERHRQADHQGQDRRRQLPARPCKPEGGKQVFEGQLPIKRLAFNIGEGEWKDTSMVADEVVIKFRVSRGAVINPLTPNKEVHMKIKHLDRRTGRRRRRQRRLRRRHLQDRPEPHLPELRSRPHGHLGLARQVHQDQRHRRARPRGQDRRGRHHHRPDQHRLRPRTS